MVYLERLILRVVLLERGDGRVKLCINFKEGQEANCVEYILYLLVGVEQLDILLESTFPLLAHCMDR